MRVLALFLTTLASLTAQAQAGQLVVSITPSFTWVTETNAHGTFEVSNTGTRPAEVVLTARGGIIESTPDGGTLIGPSPNSPLMDLSPHLQLYPPRMILEPGAKQVIRYAVRSAAALPQGAHIALLDYRVNERAPANEEQVPAVATGLIVEYALVAPVVMLHGEGAPVLSAEVVTHEAERLVLLLQAGNEWPWAGTILLQSPDGESTYGAGEATVFTRRVAEIRLSRPVEGELRLVFAPEATGISPSVLQRLSPPPPLTITL